jgi:hypothetical protein
MPGALGSRHELEFGDVSMRTVREHDRQRDAVVIHGNMGDRHRDLSLLETQPSQYLTNSRFFPSNREFFDFSRTSSLSDPEIVK